MDCNHWTLSKMATPDGETYYTCIECKVNFRPGKEWLPKEKHCGCEGRLNVYCTRHGKGDDPIRSKAMDCMPDAPKSDEHEWRKALLDAMGKAMMTIKTSDGDFDSPLFMPSRIDDLRKHFLPPSP